VRRRLLSATAALLGAAVVFPTAASAHAGLGGRSDLPIPQWLFAWAGSIVLVISFLALAVLWPRPRYQQPRWRPLPGGVGRVLGSRPVELLCGLIGVALFVFTIYSGFAGNQMVQANFAPTFVLVIFWVGLVPASLLFGDVFKAFNPWRTIGKAIAWVATKAARTDLPAPLAYPQWLGNWPAAVGIFAFATAELVIWAQAPAPDQVSIATLVYSAITFLGMALYGVEAWTAKGEAFSVYFNLFSRPSVFERRDREVGLRPFLSGLPQLKPVAGTVPLLAVMIGSVSFDGLGEGPQWASVSPDISTWFRDLGLSPQHSVWATFFIGLLLAVILIGGFYMLGVVGARSAGGKFTREELARTFVHSLVPIALAYVSAHYLTYLLYNGQNIIYLASNPLGHGTDFFGTADRLTPSYFFGSSTVWYFQVAFVVAGHAAGLTLAHDRALSIYERSKTAVRSQYWMLGVMVGFSNFALWILSQSNT
jgi:hypothetical protein